MKTAGRIALLFALTSFPCLADEPHQHEHGGPPERLGKVDFRVSCNASTEGGSRMRDGLLGRRDDELPSSLGGR